MSYITYEVNRFINLRCGKVVPHRIMYNKNVVKFLAKGGEMLPDDTLSCKARWQPGYDKLYPSQVYGNWFNYQYFDVSWASTTATQNSLKWLYNYQNRRTIECNVAGKSIVTLVNGYTINSGVKHPHLDIATNASYNKYRAMQYSPYSCSNQVFGPQTLNDYSYESEYWDVRHFSGYSVSRYFLNNVDGFSISYTTHLVSLLKSDSRSYTGTGNLTFLSTQILDSQYQALATLKIDSTYHAADVTISTGNAYPTKYVFANIINGNTQTTIDPNGPYVQVRLRTNINETDNTQVINKLNCEDVDGFAAYNTLTALANSESYPNVTITITCDKKTFKIYLNGKLYSSKNIESLLQDGGQFSDIDLLMERSITYDIYGNIASQSVTGSAYTKLYNINVFSECLTQEQVTKVFQESKKYLSTSYYYMYEGQDRPAWFIEGVGPKSSYQAPIDPIETFKTNTYYSVIYSATAHSETYGDYAVMTRAENVTNRVVWTFDNSSVFSSGGTTIAHANFNENGYPSFSKDYTITVSAPSR